MKKAFTLLLLAVCLLGVWSQDGIGPKTKPRSKRQTNSDDVEFLNAHNDKRRIVNPSAANMLEMKWSQELADIARNHAQKCVFAHNGQRSAQSTTFTYVGENIYIGPASAAAVVKEWDDEKAVYGFSGNTCSGVCGHYTQVAWHNSEYLGCARVECGNNYFYSVCNYGPGGNYNGQQPYTAGISCSLCPDDYGCNNQLCSKSSTTSNPCNPNPCLNGGTCAQSSTGSAVCTCTQGWTGSVCQTQVSSGNTLHTCDFESRLCLNNENTDTANFFRLQSYFGIGPSQGSYYAVFTSSSTTQQYAFLVAEAYLPEVSVRVTFDYTTYGTGMVYFSYGQGETTRYTSLFNSSGDNKVWKTASATIPAGKKSFYYFTGYAGGNGFGVVAIDNVRVTQL